MNKGTARWMKCILALNKEITLESVLDIIRALNECY